jgi:hypothetical protein
MSTSAEDGMLTEQDAPEFDQEIIEQATKYGWKSPDDWKGDEPPNGFMKPDEFLARPAVQLKVTQDKFDEFKATQEEIQAEQRETAARMKAMYEESAERRREAHQAELDRIKAEKAQAYADHDVDKLQDLDRQQEQLKPVETEATVTEDPSVASWKAKNGWFENDLFAKGKAIEIADTVARVGGDWAAQQAAIDREMPRIMPHLFEKPKLTQTTSKVDGGGLAQLGANPQSYDSLPSDARAQADLDIAEGLFKDKEAWAKSYYGVS